MPSPDPSRSTSRDGSFTPPPAPPAALVLDARFEPGDVLRLAWRWEHADGRTSPVEASVAAAAADPELDDDLLARVADELGWVPLDAVVLRGADAAEFTAERMPRLERLAETSALRIDVTGERPDYREATAVPQVTVTTVETLKRDWFDLGIVLTVDGRLVPFMPLFRALAKGQKRLLLVDKSYLMLNQPVFAPLRELIEEAGTLAEWETGLRIHRSQTSLWADFEDLADVAEPAVEWRRLVAGLEDGRVEELPQPAGVALPLAALPARGLPLAGVPVGQPPRRGARRRHGPRQDGADARADRAHRRAAGDGCRSRRARDAAADPSRTRPTSAEPRRPFLVVAPTSVASNWVSEAARFTPGLRVATVTATEAKRRGRIADAAASADLVVTTYAVLRLEAAAFARGRVGRTRARRGAVREERGDEGARGGPRHPCAVPPRGHRHADREQPRRAVGDPAARGARPVPVAAGVRRAVPAARSSRTATPSGASACGGASAR